MPEDFRGVHKRTSPIEGFFQRLSLKTSPFSGNRSAERAYARSERIAAALYLLTNHIQRDEPIRRIIREHALLLLDAVLSIRDEMRSPESMEIASLQSSIRFLISLVRMLVASGSVSHQNADIVIESIDELGNFVVSSQRSTLSENVGLLRQDLDIPETFIGHRATRNRVTLKDIKDTGDIKDDTRIKDASRLSVKESLSDTVSGRKQSILEILRSGGELGIRDVSSNVPQYSEKMVQRELAELIALGLVRRAGTKRWSRYSVVERGDKS